MFVRFDTALTCRRSNRWISARRRGSRTRNSAWGCGNLGGTVSNQAIVCKRCRCRMEEHQCCRKTNEDLCRRLNEDGETARERLWSSACQVNLYPVPFPLALFWQISGGLRSPSGRSVWSFEIWKCTWMLLCPEPLSLQGLIHVWLLRTPKLTNDFPGVMHAPG